ncbi:InlB B-repeat-containing protein [Candidatus Xianfuyuplasma coldseepsis]|uniref:InlB B-repeat-containing protein n=1 Tax=Candidatus Xianfuyuplasma coldseepsis TaxID=2782163 RepID=A0A7L7KQZ0_9MOLU|nr:InlB B-repeat-containing protein [Xianfuyuplasma coldseepsis]QMS85097.1 InlB B-repeat-containing protein [Xianfuyuplasma coldseepsis]
MKRLSLSVVFIIMIFLSGCETLDNIEVSDTYTIQFDSKGGSFVAAIDVSLGDDITFPKNPTKEGFTFEGWYVDDVTFTNPLTADFTVLDDLIVYAKWEETESSLELQLQHIYELATDNGIFEGTYEEWLETVRGPQGVPGEDGDNVVIAVNDDQIQWKYDEDSAWVNLISISDLQGNSGVDGIGIQATTLDASGNLIITYTDDSEDNLGPIVSVFRVNFYDFNKHILDTALVEYGGSATTIVTPVRTGYTFTGWSRNDYSNVTADMNVFAEYDVNIYTVTFNSTGGSEEAPVTDIEYGTTLALPTPTKEGYTFTGWYRGYSINATQVYNNDPVNGNWTLYARWDEIPQTVEPQNQDQTTLKIILDSEEAFYAAYFIEEMDGHPYESLDVAYKILSVENSVIQQLSSWTSSQASQIEVSSEEVTEQTITTGLEISINTTIEASALFVTTSVEMGITASIEYSVSKARSTGQSVSFSLDDYEEGLDYAVFLTGDYDVYQVFSYNYETKQVTEAIFVRITSSPVMTVLSSPNGRIDTNINIEDHKIEFDRGMFFEQGDGSSEAPYQISSEAGIFAMMLNSSGHYELVNDIQLNRYQGAKGVFSGVLHGNGHTISGLNITIPEGRKDVDEFYGFFGKLSGTVENIIFSDCHITHTYSYGAHDGDGYIYAGIVAGYADALASFTNITVIDSSVKASRYKSHLGGIAGHANGTVSLLDIPYFAPTQIPFTNVQVINTDIIGCGIEGGILGYGNYVTIDSSSFKGQEVDGVQHYAKLSHYSTGIKGYAGCIAGFLIDSTVQNNHVEYTNIIYLNFHDQVSSVKHFVGNMDLSSSTNTYDPETVTNPITPDTTP